MSTAITDKDCMKISQGGLDVTTAMTVMIINAVISQCMTMFYWYKHCIVHAVVKLNLEWILKVTAFSFRNGHQGLNSMFHM